MNTFKNYGCPKGAPGAMGVDYAQLEKTISFAMHQFMAKREEILLGGKPEPPEVTGYKFISITTVARLSFGYGVRISG